MSHPHPPQNTGRAYRMIMGLPETGSIVVCASWYQASLIRDAVKQLRGDAVASSTLFISQHGAESVIRARDLPLFRDHACSD